MIEHFEPGIPIGLAVIALAFILMAMFAPRTCTGPTYDRNTGQLASPRVCSIERTPRQ